MRAGRWTASAIAPIDMKRSLETNLVIGGLALLLMILGAMQYHWQTQISENEAEKMQDRVQEDVDRFSEDFDREIQNAYFNFQTDADTWKSKDWAAFNERLDYWRSKTTYPTLIRGFYFVEAKRIDPALKYDSQKREFIPADDSSELRILRERMGDANNSQSVYADLFALVLPVQDPGRTIERIMIRRTGSETPPAMKMPDRYASLVILLDEDTIKGQILRDLAQKYFPGQEFRLSVNDNLGTPVFRTFGGADNSDAVAPLFDLSPNNLIFFANKDVLPANGKQKDSVILTSRIEKHPVSDVPRVEPSRSKVNVEVHQGDGRQRTVFTTTANGGRHGEWTLSAQHVDGSVASFVNGVRRRNLGIGFGVLALLGIAVGAIIYSAQRARRYAQRQVDFVSSVSHEFRTPLAVIYSAGENLADGVATEREQVNQYGNLIKGEGKKLSSMVEQILEFAGSDSGSRNFKLEDTSVATIVEKAVEECRPLIEESGFVVEKKISPELTKIRANEVALTQAIQNLIANSVKYSGEARWMSVSAVNGGGVVKISVTDRGIGIGKTELRYVFEPFYRAKDVVDAQIHGNGLGLSIVKQIAEAHGGRVSAVSEKGKGSTFVIEIPQSR